MLFIKSAAAAAAMTACLAANVAAEPAHADPAFISGAARSLEPKTVTSFRVAGANLSVTAIGRLAASDTLRRVEDLEEARAMAKVLPGFPQPAYVTFGLRLSY